MHIGRSPSYLYSVALVIAAYVAAATVYNFSILPRLPSWHEVPLPWWGLLATPTCLALFLAGFSLQRWSQVQRHGLAMGLAFSCCLIVGAVIRERTGGPSALANHARGEWPATFLILLILYIAALGVTYAVLQSGRRWSRRRGLTTA